MRYMKKLCALFAFAVFLLPLFPAAQARADMTPLPIRIEPQGSMDPEDGEAVSYVRYPLFVSDDDALAPALEKANRLIQKKARIPEYLQLLSTVQQQTGGTGLQMDYQWSALTSWKEGEGPQIYDWYVSILFSAKGKMLSGRPSQVYYPMTIDLRTGEEVPFDRLFTNPEGAKAFMETVLEEEVEPSLSTYLENSQLFPVPFDRYWLDNFGRVNLYYENSQLSFLSGYSGAVSFRYSELDDWLDKTDDGLIAHFSYGTLFSNQSLEQRREGAWGFLQNAMLLPAARGLSLQNEVDTALDTFRPAADSGYYPGGAYYELEDAAYRGTLLLTDEAEEKVTGLLSSRVDLYDIETGKTALSDAIVFLGREPDASLALDETAANMYLVCPGTAAVYRLNAYDGAPLTFTLYADANGIVQYLKLSLAGN